SSDVCSSDLKIGNPTSQILAKACREMSRRDGAIVAWHEVPGTAPPQKSHPVGYGMIRAGVRTDTMIGVTHRLGFIKPFQTSETLLGNRAMAHSAFGISQV